MKSFPQMHMFKSHRTSALAHSSVRAKSQCKHHAVCHLAEFDLAGVAAEGWSLAGRGARDAVGGDEAVKSCGGKHSNRKLH